ncbi:MAG: type IV pilus twitching motility protein PilT, partial [bacterium]
MDLRGLLEELVRKKGSDLHIKVGVAPMIRINGRLEPLDCPPATIDYVDGVCEEILTPKQRKEFEDQNEVDFAIGVPGLARFRANLYRQRGSTAMVFRLIPFDPPSLDELNLPPVIRDLALKPRGLILVTGTVGSGKSTTLAAMIKEINDTQRKNIITIEDPIE